ncbi:MAG: aminotransferase class V-fold PLP-dependent enzyme, partial [Eggerthella sp.]|nr:aminotransferase class V-fold PLP-dependent enzyme [Eggerthella sp.]
MADQKRIWRLGIDVGGTNTDAVVIDGDLKLVAATKSPTTEDVMSGIVAAMHEVITQIGADAARNIGFAMLGTTHCTNAIVERKRLNKVAALRVGAPATTAISCMADWPDELKNAMRVRDFLVHGGNEFDGREISALSEDEIREVARDWVTYGDPPHRFEAGTPMIVEAVGLGAAIDYVNSVGKDRIAAHEHDLLTYAQERLREINALRIIGTAKGKGPVISFEMK